MHRISQAEYTPKGNRYVFFRNQPLGIAEQDDLEYFKSEERFEVEGFKTKVREILGKGKKKETEPEKEEES